MAARVWFILGAAWFTLALGWFLWRDYAMAYNFAAVICGYPNAAAPEFSTCMAEKLPLAKVTMHHQLVVHDSFYIVLPGLALALIGVLVRSRGRPAV